MKDICIYGGVQMTWREHEVISAIAAGGTCPYCDRRGLSRRWGADRRHMSACRSRLTLLEREKAFATLLGGDGSRRPRFFPLDIRPHDVIE